MGLRAMLPNNIPACRSDLKLSIMKSFLIVECVKEASAVCQGFLDGVIIFFGRVPLILFSPFPKFVCLEVA